MNQHIGERVVLQKSGKRINLLRVANSQRALLLVILGVIVMYFGVLFGVRLVPATTVPVVQGVVLMCYVILGVIAVVITVRLAIAVGSNPVIAVICGFGMFIPLLGILLMASANGRATRVLKQHGVRVGLMGVPEDEMHKLRVGGCPKCGYDIRGLPAGTCPECGGAIAPPTMPRV